MAFDRRETAILLIGDFLILIASLWAALSLRNLAFPGWGYFQTNVIPFLPVFLLSLVIFYIAGLYEKPTRFIRRVMGTRILGAQGATVAIAAILFFVFPLSIAPKTILVLYLVVSVIAESFWRFSRMAHEVGDEHRASTLLIGRGQAVSELLEEVNHNSRYLLRFTEQVDLENGERLAPIIAAHARDGVRTVVIDAGDPIIAAQMPELYELMTDGVTFIDFVGLYEEVFDRVPLAHLTPERVLESLPKRRSLYDAAKRILDLLLALVLVIVALPFIAVAAVPLSFSGAPFIRHERIGKDGKTFRIVKLRTMLFNDHGDPELQKKNRVTLFGKLLRKTRIDELPQLWNVLQGELSFIGPRPELPAIAAVYEKEIPHYRMRHLIVPGLSGWAQIHDYDAPRGGADVPRTRRKLSFDLYYLTHRSFGLDLIIALKTVRALASLSGK